MKSGTVYNQDQLDFKGHPVTNEQIAKFAMSLISVDSEDEVIEILKVAKPKKAVITHMGIKILRAGPAEEAKRITEESDVKTIAAKDGLRLNV